MSDRTIESGVPEDHAIFVLGSGNPPSLKHPRITAEILTNCQAILPGNPGGIFVSHRQAFSRLKRYIGKFF